MFLWWCTQNLKTYQPWVLWANQNAFFSYDTKWWTPPSAWAAPVRTYTSGISRNQYTQKQMKAPGNTHIKRHMHICTSSLILPFARELWASCIDFTPRSWKPCLTACIVYGNILRIDPLSATAPETPWAIFSLDLSPK